MNPGSIVRCRNREWVLLPAKTDDVFVLRPLTGTTEDVVELHRGLMNLVGYDLPFERVTPASFPMPTEADVSEAAGAHLLWQAARLTLREGATPFRSLGRISIRPRTYQFVPLLMALRLDPVRLFIADDVGVGKTIEALLIARELLDRGKIQRFCVLCPPYLCDQCAREIAEKFALEPVVIRSGTVGQLERQTPPGRSLYQHFYISDAFEAQHAKLEGERDQGADPEDPDEYRAANVFWVPPEARWERLRANARQPTIVQIVDEAMEAIERDNPILKGVLPKDYPRPALDKTRLGQLIDLVTNIPVGNADARSRDVLGRVYEYFLGQFASAEGKKGGEFYTPRCVVRLLVEMLEPFQGRVYDPCCGSAGMFVQSVEFIEAHATGNGGRARSQISIYGQELNYTKWRRAKMNLAIRGIDGRIEQGDTFHNDRFPDLKADYILANPPFNMKEWGGQRLREDKRWKFGTPPVRNANFCVGQMDRLNMRQLEVGDHA